MEKIQFLFPPLLLVQIKEISNYLGSMHISLKITGLKSYHNKNVVPAYPTKGTFNCFQRQMANEHFANADFLDCNGETGLLGSCCIFSVVGNYNL